MTGYGFNKNWLYKYDDIFEFNFKNYDIKDSDIPNIKQYLQQLNKIALKIKEISTQLKKVKDEYEEYFD